MSPEVEMLRSAAITCGFSYSYLLSSEGKKVGVLLVAESLTKENSLPKITKKIATGINTAALGLVVALLVLMI